MSIFNKLNRKGGFMDEIRCDETSYLIWKWHPAGVQIGEGSRENAIRWGSSLRVKVGEVAVFVNSQGNNVIQEFIEGPCDMILSTGNLPIIADLIGTSYDGGTPFQAEVYFINLAQIIQTKFAVPFFDVYDPRFPDFGVPVAVRGTVTFRIDDYKEFIKLHRLNSFNLNDFQMQIRDSISRYVKDCVANAPAYHNIPVIQIESKISQINDTVEYDIHQRLKETFGVAVSAIDIGAIEIDKTSDSYRQLMSITKELAGATAKAEAEAEIKNITDKQRIDIENYAEALRIQREEGQYLQHKKTQTDYLAAFQIEKQAEVGIAGANALGQMGASGSAGSLGSNDGFNITALTAGMAVGNVVGQNLAGTMNNILGAINNATVHGAAPIPVSATAYYVAVNGQATGAFSIPELKQLAANGQFAGDSLVWKDGMPQWEKASTINELKGLFNGTMPAVPKTDV